VESGACSLLVCMSAVPTPIPHHSRTTISGTNAHPHAQSNVVQHPPVPTSALVSSDEHPSYLPPTMPAHP
jgi:hypothetical protein